VPGFCMGAWAPLIPFVKQRLEIDDWALGMLLLCLGAGSIFTMPFSSALAHRFGCRLVIGISCVFTCAALICLSIAPDVPTVVASLLVFGAAVGSADCVANIQAVIVERHSGKAMMSGFHGCFSAGGLAGATGVAIVLSVGSGPLLAISTVVAIAIIATAFSLRGALSYAGEAGPAFAVPRFAILLIGILALIAALAEGAVLDWSAVFLSSLKGLDVTKAGIGYAVFAMVMTGGRLFGDIFVRRLGSTAVVMVGGVLSSFGFVVAVLSSSWHVAIVGFAFIGAGVSNLFPVLVSLSGRQKIVPENIAIPAVLTLGYIGILAGPALVGFLTHFMSLPGTFLLLAGALLGVAAAARAI
jgi:hypothetical protein